MAEAEANVIEERVVRIDPEFSALIPPPSACERAALASSLLAEGCRDALVIWQGILLDGHTRHALCEQHQWGYRTVDIELTDRDAAKEWIIRNQLGRRNLRPFQRAELVAHLEPLIAARAKENQRGCKKSDNPIDTKQEMARLAEMSPDTWVKAKRLITNAPDKVKQQLRGNEITINRATKQLNEQLVRRPAKKQAKKRATSDLPPYLVGAGGVYIVLPLRPGQTWRGAGPHIVLVRDTDEDHSQAEIRSRKAVVREIKNGTLVPAADRQEVLAKRGGRSSAAPSIPETDGVARAAEQGDTCEVHPEKLEQAGGKYEEAAERGKKCGECGALNRLDAWVCECEGGCGAALASE
jgi:hypothetical protein